MIKINLLAELGDTKASAASTPGDEGIGQYKTPIFASIVVIVLALYGIWAYTYKQKTVVLSSEIKELERELEKLKEVIKEKDKFQKQKEELERKIAVIENLKKEQKTPVFVMDQFSVNLPDHVWIEDWKAGKGDKEIALKGGAMTTLALTNFIENLKMSPLVTDVVFNGASEKKGYLEYNLSCTLAKLKKENQ